jgi:NADPH-dependent 2,4-dienoyl-CoA reductase/sulfur reductase-like enzyme
MPFSRRLFLGASSAAVVGTTLGSPAFSENEPRLETSRAKGRFNSSSDVVIVGGGISGLIAAVELEKKGNTTTVLEASSRLGG